MQNEHIAITGVGIVSPLGIGFREFWNNLSQGKSGIKPISLFDTSDLTVKVGGEISDFNPKMILGDKNLMDLDRATLLLLSAAKLALEDAKYEVTPANTMRTGVSIGTTFGSLHSISKFDRESLTEGPQYVNPSIFPSTVGNSPASRISIRFQIKGFNSTISTGSCAQSDAFDYARDSMRLNRADTIVTGSVEDLSLQTFLGFYKLGYLSGSKGGGHPLSCPFDAMRNGIVFSEGAVVFILQNAKKAPKKQIYAEISGIGSSFDVARFYTYNPKAAGMIKAMKAALADAHLKPQDIDCIFANANSTKDGDAIETKAIKEVFGRHSRRIPVTATKSMLGESLSASAGFSVAAALGAFRYGVIPPTINYLEQDPDCDLDCVPNLGRKKAISHAMINAFGFNGTNTSIILSKQKDAIWNQLLSNR